MSKKNVGYKLEYWTKKKAFYIVWYERGNRRCVSTGTSCGEQADKFLTEFKEREKRRQTSRLIDDILADYLEQHGPHVAHPDDIAQSVKALAPFWAEMSADEVTPIKCQQFAAWRKKEKEKVGETISNATIRRNLAYLQAALNYDFEGNRLKVMPKMWLPEKPDARQRWLTRKEAAALIRAARKQDARSKHLPWFILLSLYSGQRMRAVLNLTWDRVDMERGMINWQYGRSTKKHRPYQPMPDEVKMFLTILQKYGTTGYTLNINGRQIKTVKDGFKTAVDTAGIPHASPHTLKHTAITWMLQNGTGPWAVSGFTGTSLHTITTVYGHHSSDYLEEARCSSKTGRARRRAITTTKTAPKTAPKQNVVTFPMGVNTALSA